MIGDCSYIGKVFVERKIKDFVFALGGGLLYSSAFPMSFLPPFIFTGILGIALLFYFIVDKSLKSKFLSVLFFCMGFNLLGYYWIPYTVNTFGKVLFPFDYMLGGLFSTIVAPYLFIFATFLHLMEKKRHLFSENLYALFLAFGFTFFEYFTPQQFPAHLGHTFLPFAPYLIFAKVFGAPFYSFLGAWSCFVALNFFRTKKINYSFLLFFILTVLLHLFLPLKFEGEKSLKIRIVQPNIGNLIKLSSESGFYEAVDHVEKTYLDLTLSENASSRDLIIWPETAYPTIIKSQFLKEDLSSLPPLISQITQETTSEIFFGGYDSEYDLSTYENKDYNTAFFIDENRLKGYYHKIKLIPFGEGLPFGPLNQYLKKYIKNISYFAKGDEFPFFQTKNGKGFISAICYEILFSDFIRNYLREVHPKNPQFLINLTNDSWYGDTAEPEQHLFLAKWRALEFQLPIVRSTNTGISTIIYPDGKEGPRLGVFEKNILDVDLKLDLKREETLFQFWGIYGLFIPFIILILMIKIEAKLREKSLL